MNRLTVLLILLGLAAAPVLVGSAESTDKADTAKAEGKQNEIAKAEKEEKADKAAEKVVAKSKIKNECLASEEIIKDLEEREQKLKDREASLLEHEKEVDAQAKAVKEEVAKLETNRTELQGAHAKDLAEREEKVNKLIETFETMSPKTAAQVIGGVDDELAVTALSRLTSVKAGKILGNLKPEKSAKLSEMMAYGNKAAVASTGKEKARGESNERTPASSQ